MSRVVLPLRFLALTLAILFSGSCAAAPRADVERYLASAAPLIFGKADKLGDWSPRPVWGLHYVVVDDGRNDILFLSSDFTKSQPDRMVLADDTPRSDLLIDARQARPRAIPASTSAARAFTVEQSWKLFRADAELLRASPQFWESGPPPTVFLFRDKPTWRNWASRVPKGAALESIAVGSKDAGSCGIVKGPIGQSGQQAMALAILLAGDRVDLGDAVVSRCLRAFVLERQGLKGAAARVVQDLPNPTKSACVLGVIAPAARFEGAFSDRLGAALGLGDREVAGCRTSRGDQTELITRHFELLFENKGASRVMSREQYRRLTLRHWDAARRHARLSSQDLEKLEKGTLHVGR